MINIYFPAIPDVHVTPRIQSKRPREDAVMYCHVVGEPFPKVEWLKNDERLHLEQPHKYQIVGNGTALKIHNIAFADTGAYMCQATNVGGLTRDISSLVVQEQPTPSKLFNSYLVIVICLITYYICCSCP